MWLNEAVDSHVESCQLSVPPWGLAQHLVQIKKKSLLMKEGGELLSE